jgi:hypothetical protein
MSCSKCIHESNKGLKFAIRALHNIKITTLFLLKIPVIPRYTHWIHTAYCAKKHDLKV